MKPSPSPAAAAGAIPAAAPADALQPFLALAPIGLVQAADDGRIAFANALAAERLQPLAGEGGLHNLFDALLSVAPDLRAQAAAFTAPQGLLLDHLPLHPRSAKPASLALTLLKLAPGRWLAMIDDTSAETRRERELQQLQAWTHGIVKGVADHGLATLDAQGLCRDWNASLGRVTGFDADSLVGRSPALLAVDAAAAERRLAERLLLADATGWSHDEGWLARPDGSRYWGSSLITPLRTHDLPEPGPRCYSLIVRDISHLREARSALRGSISSDPLTGLSNRRAFHESGELELARSLRAPRALAVLRIDIEDFVALHAEHGHPAGDALLRHLAGGLSATLRSSDLVARTGGPAFVALLCGADAAQALGVAERLCRHVAGQVLEVDGVPIRYRISAGVAALQPGDAAPSCLDELVLRADCALDAARRRPGLPVGCWSEDTATAAAA
ncbi:MAG: sensor domain-containing diguanylate cyclase [Proteobacteria bacterium]|nr:sensor domain-containing diguanylate cyclase [Pseudomonadota bacterium]